MISCRKLREPIAEKTTADEELLGEELEAEESYFGGVRECKPSCGAASTVTVFALLKPGDKVFVLPIPDVRSNMPMPIMHKKIKSVSIVYTDTFQRYNVLDVSEFKQYKNSHSKLSANEKISNANT